MMHMPIRTTIHRDRAILSVLALLTLAASGLFTRAGAVQLRRDAIGSLGSHSVQPGLRCSDTAGLPVIGTSTQPGLILWNGFWFPAAGTPAAVPEIPPAEPTPEAFEPDLPARTRLAGISPNPIAALAELRFEIAPRGGGNETAAVPTSVRVFDVTGRLTATLLDGAIAPGYHRVTWDPGREHGPMSNGIYFIRFTSGDHAETRRIVLLR